MFWYTAVSGNPLVLEGPNKPAYIVFALCEKCMKPREFQYHTKFENQSIITL